MKEGIYRPTLTAFDEEAAVMVTVISEMDYLSNRVIHFREIYRRGEGDTIRTFPERFGVR